MQYWYRLTKYIRKVKESGEITFGSLIIYEGADREVASQVLAGCVLEFGESVDVHVFDSPAMNKLLRSYERTK